VSTWIEPCSGRLQIWKTSCLISGPTSTFIARILHWKGERLTKMRLCRFQSPVSIPMDGNPTVEVSITHRSLPDSPKKHDPLSVRRAASDCTSNGNQLMFVLVNAARLADLILSLPPTALRQRDSPHLGSAVAGRIGQNSNSPWTGSSRARRRVGRPGMAVIPIFMIHSSQLGPGSSRGHRRNPNR